MHCASCKTIIEKKLLQSGIVSKADASMAKGTVTVVFKDDTPSTNMLNRLFPNGNYSFSESPSRQHVLRELIMAVAISVGVMVIIAAVNSSGLLPVVTIDQNSSPGAFFLFGLLAGASSCAALLGGLMLSLSSRWMTRYDGAESLFIKLEPHLLFNTGRILAFTFLGGLLGLLGETLRLTPMLTNIMVIAVSLFMIVIALQMLGLTFFNRFNLAMPKLFYTTPDAPERNSLSWHPLSAGAMTILLPCGFTMAAEGAAVLSGNAVQGMLIMFCFVLGTMASLMAIGLTSLKLGGNPRTSSLYLKTAGTLVIFFSVYNLNAQFGLDNLILGADRQNTSISTTRSSAAGGSVNTAATTGASNVAVMTTIYTSAKDIVPSTFNIRAGQKVRFVIDTRDTGYGCMSTIMVPGLWDRPEPLVKGKPIVMEFTPQKPGSYRITCAMGVPRGVINVR
jgi:sulfite exporter TauE/SafE/plastocyanin